MKRYSSFSSSSSSSVGFENEDQPEKDKTKRRRKKQKSEKCEVKKANNQSHGRRSSIYKGVTRHRWTGKFEAHLCDNTSWNGIQNKKGTPKGPYDSEEAAARTFEGQI